MADPKTCMYPDCGKPAKLRGLCTSCYMSARRMVTKGETTWEALEKAGKCTPRRRGGPGKSGWFLAKAE